MSGRLRAGGASRWLSQFALLLSASACRDARPSARSAVDAGLTAHGPVRAPVSVAVPAKATQTVVAHDPLQHELTLDRFPGTSFFVEQIMNELAVAEMRELHPVGSTSTVFRAQLRAPFRAAFKVATHDRPRGPIAEVAAYRLARCLELPNVPPAVLRRLPKNTLQRGLDRMGLSKWPSIEPRLIVDRAGKLEGAAIFWIEGMRDLPYATAGTRTDALRALKLGQPAAAQPLAAQLSDLLVFDWLTGNWDRWSGGNLKSDERGELLYMRDNDASFTARLNPELEERVLAPVLESERFSRSLVMRVRALTRRSFEHELAQDPGFAADLSRIDEPAFVGLFERRGRFLAHVQALVDAHGEAEVLAFP